MGITWGGTDRQLTDEEIERLDPRTREAIRRQRERRDPLADFLDPGGEPEEKDDGGFGW